MTSICYVYLIRCNNNALYTGITSDYIRRWLEHKSGRGARYIRNNGFKKPVFLQKFQSRADANQEERFIKKQDKQYKEWLINSNLNMLKKDPRLPKKTWKLLGCKKEYPF